MQACLAAYICFSSHRMFSLNLTDFKFIGVGNKDLQSRMSVGERCGERDLFAGSKPFLVVMYRLLCNTACRGLFVFFFYHFFLFSFYVI